MSVRENASQNSAEQADETSQPESACKHGFRDDLTIAARGIMMGAADVVPGVSGGTVALIVGVYTRLVTALARFDTEFLGLLKAGQLTTAARHVDLRFLLVLGTGILTGIVSLARVINHLLSHHHELTFAAFYGLILASGLLIARRVTSWTLGRALLLVVAIFAAFWFTGAFTTSATADDTDISTWYIFICGCIAICAMILPGISGSFILLILGAYGTVIGMVSAVTKGNINSSNVLGLATFACGCLVGLLSFSKMLRWLLTKFQFTTLAALCGIMLGAVRGVWPFREVTISEDGHPNFGPNQWPSIEELWMPALVAVAAFCFVLALDWMAARWFAQHVPNKPST